MKLKLLVAQNMAEARAIPSLGGYDEEFVNAVEGDWQCAICQLPLKDPMLTKCGHRFCRQCLDEHFRRLEIDGQQSSCPVDRNNLNQNKDTFPDKATERKILCLTIRCPNKDCDWTGELRSKENHLAFCPLTIISCPYADMGCKKKIQRKEVDSHFHSAMKLHIDLAFLKLNDTQVQLNDTQVQLNDTQVQLSKTQDEFKETIRRLEEKFNSSQQEFKETKRKLEEKFNSSQRDQKKLEEKVTVLEKMMQCSEEHNYFQWKISSFKKVLKKAKDNEKIRIYSDPFYRYGYKCIVFAYPNGYSSGENTYLSILLAIMKGEHDDILPWPFHKMVTFTVIDQQELAEDRENIVKHFTTDAENDPKQRQCFSRPVNDVNIGKGIAGFASHKKLHERCYIVDDAILIQVELAPPQ